jgi:internalin A
LRFERLPKLQSLFVLTDPSASTQSLTLSELPSLIDLTLGVLGPWPEQSGGSQTRQLMQQISRLRNLRQLDIHADDIDDLDVRQLTQLPNLNRLTIGPCNVSNEGLRSIAQIKTLTELEIDSERISTAGIQHLAQLPDLQSLRLKRSSHQEDPGAALLQLPALTQLTLGGCWYPSLTLTDENAAGRNILLDSVSIYSPKGTSLIESEAKVRIAGLPSVESIHLTHPDADHFELALENLVHLRSLQINLSRGDEIHEFTLSKLPRLQNVILFGEDSKIPAETLRRLRIWKDTRQVNIRGVEALEVPTN